VHGTSWLLRLEREKIKYRETANRAGRASQLPWESCCFLVGADRAGFSRINDLFFLLADNSTNKHKTQVREYEKNSAELGTKKATLFQSFLLQ
jgi:hypothetical protein